MTRYYEIARLTRGASAHFADDRISVDLDGHAEIIVNDVQFNAARDPDDVFWLSGGGTYLINGRWLALVRRRDDAMVNPGKYSLFIGRSDNADERARPRALVRELFEELLLYRDGTLLKPQLAAHQEIIDTVYRGRIEPNAPLFLSEVPLFGRKVSVVASGVRHDDQLCCHVSTRNDINVFFLFAANLEMRGVTAADGEGQARSIVLYDFRSGEVLPFSGAADVGRRVTRSQMTEPLQFFLDHMPAASPILAD